MDFFSRYQAFEQAIHAKYPEMRLIGSAGPDITSERYTAAWDFYKEAAPKKENFVYAVDEHYYVKPEWFYAHTDFYDEYPRNIKVFSGEYAAHPVNGMNRPDANTLGGALAEAAFLTGVERNADVVVLASYAPLFARVGYAQWSPDMIWFDDARAYGTPSYYVQKLYGENLGTVTGKGPARAGDLCERFLRRGGGRNHREGREPQRAGQRAFSASGGIVCTGWNGEAVPHFRM